MFRKISLFLVVLFGFINSTTVARQADPWELTGVVFYDGKPLATGFLCGSGHTMITCAHVLYRPNEGRTSLNPTIHFSPGATMNDVGQLVMPHGKIRVVSMAYDPDYRKYASASNGEEVWERVRRDCAVCTLERDPGLGFFDFVTNDSETEAPSPTGIETWYCGYPNKTHGKQYQASMMLNANGDGKRLWSYGEKFDDIKGLSGAPFFRFFPDKKRWAAIGIMQFCGADDGIWWHVRITEDCAKNLGQHAQLATRN